ncbi:NAD(P)-dependent oxidoreductase [Reichenbachiella sp. MALMAid0571]|uniref:NAD(P)-dependent oxidoreductase n=1 Tax=Reichenbachiella sp. MALMAid0571 TaxID=3143939 RepID=UPI0032DE3EEC
MQSHKKKILIIDTMHQSIIPLLEDLDFDVDYKPKITRQEIIDTLSEYVGIVVRSKTTIDAELLQNAGKLKFVARAGAGIDQLDVRVLENRKITIVNAPEGNRDALGEHALGMLLCLANKINVGDLMVRQMVWDREGHRGFELKDKTIALIGYGQMGSAFSEKLVGLSCNVIAYDKYKSGYSSLLVKEASMQEIYEKADVVSFHVPLTEETRNLADKSFFLNFRKNIVVLNTSRGEVLNLKDLLDFLEEGKVKCAALDVLENEKLDQLTDEQKAVFQRLIQMENVLLTPHVGGWTFESYERINQILTDKISKLSY